MSWIKADHLNFAVDFIIIKLSLIILIIAKEPHKLCLCILQKIFIWRLIYNLWIKIIISKLKCCYNSSNSTSKIFKKKLAIDNRKSSEKKIQALDIKIQVSPSLSNMLKWPSKLRSRIEMSENVRKSYQSLRKERYDQIFQGNRYFIGLHPLISPLLGAN